MISHFDHVTVVVRDLEPAIRFFGLLGFKEQTSVVISGSTFSTYMGVEGLEADHVTLVLPEASPRLEVQLLRYRNPVSLAAADIGMLTNTGYNHICFAVEDLDAEVSRLTSCGVQLKNEVMAFHGRKLVFLSGPENITVELAQWHRARDP